MRTPVADRVRLWLASLLTFIAARLAPRMMRGVFAGYCDLLAGFQWEIESGRTFGVMHGIWSMSAPAENAEKARRLQIAAIKAIERERVAIEGEAARKATQVPT